MLAPEILRVATALKVDVPALTAAADRSVKLLSEAREYLAQQVPSDDIPLDVVVLGSLARLEVGGGSDFDFLLVAHGLTNDAKQSRSLLEAVERLNRDKLRLEEPGATRMFGRVVSAADITERIGLEDDTNRTHSHRILLLQESASIYQPHLHERLLTRIAERYLLDYGLQRGRPARFLLNDVLRYWRTLTVDYQAKRWEKLGLDWGLRFLKLIISRKITLAGTIAPIFLQDDPTPDSLISEFKRTPLARLCGAFEKVEEPIRRHFGDVLTIANRFVGLLDDSDFRKEAKAVGDRGDITAGSRFAQVQEDGRQLQEALEKIFFESETFKMKSRRYLAF